MNRNKMPYRLSTSNQESLLLQLHADIEEAVQTTARAIFDGSIANRLTYPPNAGLTTAEATALQLLQNLPDLESALRKVLAETASFPVFRLLEYLDGVADPDSETWTGVCLVDNLPEQELQESFLHDEFYASYWEWRSKRPGRDWILDNLDADVTS